MKLDDLVRDVAAGHGLDTATTRAMLDAVFAQIVDAVARGEDVALAGFGKFTGKPTNARAGRNPRTGEPMQIAASTKIVFAPAKTFRERIGAASARS